MSATVANTSARLSLHENLRQRAHARQRGTDPNPTKSSHNNPTQILLFVCRDLINLTYLKYPSEFSDKLTTKQQKKLEKQFSKYESNVLKKASQNEIYFNISKQLNDYQGLFFKHILTYEKNKSDGLNVSFDELLQTCFNHCQSILQGQEIPEEEEEEDLTVQQFREKYGTDHSNESEEVSELTRTLSVV